MAATGNRRVKLNTYAAPAQHHRPDRPPRHRVRNRLGRHRYVIERTLEWVSRFRRLARRYERKASHFAGFLRLACTLICYRRITQLNLLP